MLRLGAAAHGDDRGVLEQQQGVAAFAGDDFGEQRFLQRQGLGVGHPPKPSDLDRPRGSHRLVLAPLPRG